MSCGQSNPDSRGSSSNGAVARGVGEIDGLPRWAAMTALAATAAATTTRMPTCQGRGRHRPGGWPKPLGRGSGGRPSWSGVAAPSRLRASALSALTLLPRLLILTGRHLALLRHAAAPRSPARCNIHEMRAFRNPRLAFRARPSTLAACRGGSSLVMMGFQRRHRGVGVPALAAPVR